MSDVQNRQNGRSAQKSWCSLFCFPCAGISLAWVFLLLLIVLVLLKVPLGLEHVTMSGFTVVLYKHAISPVVIFFADLLRSLFPWPFIVLIVIGLCLWKTNLLTELFSSVGAFEFAGFKFEGRTRDASAEFRKELDDVQRGMDRINKEIGEAYTSAHMYAGQLRDKYEISQSVATSRPWLGALNCSNVWRR